MKELSETEKHNKEKLFLTSYVWVHGYVCLTVLCLLILSQSLLGACVAIGETWTWMLTFASAVPITCLHKHV